MKNSFDNKDARQLTEEEVKTVNGGMKTVVEDDKSLWQTLVDFFFKRKKG